MENKIEFGKKDIVSTIIIENYERFLDVKKPLVPTKYADKWIEKQKELMLNVLHRHIFVDIISYK